MLKRLLCVLFAVLLCASVCVSAAASEAEIAAVSSAPDGLRFVFTYPNEGSECIEAVFSVPYDLGSIASSIAEYYACCIQFDWSVDSRDAFHYDTSWDKAGGNYPVQQLGGSFVEKREVFWFAYPEAAERCAGAVKESAGEGGETVRTFDFDAHDLYVRARFMLYSYVVNQCWFSDWSDVYDVGKDLGREAPKVPDVGKDRPEIEEARLDNGTLLAYLSYPDSIYDTASALLAGYGTQLSFQSQMRVDDGIWEFWSVSGDDTPYLLGERETQLPDGADAGKVEYRFRLIGNDPADGSTILTGWSDYVTVKDGEARVVKNDDPFEKKEAEKRRQEAIKEANKCKLCGICPFHPFGVCMFLWLAIVLAIVLIVVYNVRASAKKKKRAAETKAREEASRRADAKTDSFINTDRVSLHKDGADVKEKDADAKEEEAEHED
ncbi:MAG: hypothetical protein IJT44_00720 [Clostridia bacterium]|nr:hypothetical protein [Clostridia bacterium]